MRRQPTGPGQLIRVGGHTCWVSDAKVEITPPAIFGWGLLFDRARQTVTVRRRLLGFTLSHHEIPFSDVTIDLDSDDYESPHGWIGLGYFIRIGVPFRFADLTALRALNNRERVVRILSAIEQLGIRTSRSVKKRWGEWGESMDELLEKRKESEGEEGRG